jgi:hypothetical protein
MPQLGFEPTIPVFEGEKTIQTLDRAAIMIGLNFVMQLKDGKELSGSIRKQNNKEFYYKCHNQKQHILKRFRAQL